ncbi:MAG: hypothetical protein K2X81_26290 [Candidatus Obscuribacterales bacterium]|nr:hypothetical protein [Candidatus Obscuribacterales bacterium]
MFLETYASKFEHLVLNAKRAMQECLRFARVAKICLSSLLKINPTGHHQVDDAVIKRLRRMQNEFQEKESNAEQNPFRPTFLEKARVVSGTGAGVNSASTDRKKLRIMAYSQWCLQEVEKVADIRPASSQPIKKEVVFVPSASEVIIPEPPKVDKIDLNESPKTFNEYLTPTLHVFDPSFLWKNAQSALDFAPHSELSLSELFLSVQSYALVNENSTATESIDSLDFTPSDNAVLETVTSPQISIEGFPETGHLDEESCMDLLLSELNKPITDLQMFDVPLFDLPIFDVDGNLLRSF